MSLSSDEIQGRSSGGDPARLSTMPDRPRSQGDNDYVSAPARQNERHKKGKRQLEGSAGAGSLTTSHLGQATWRGRLEEEQQRRGHEKGPDLSSGKKYGDLENYLRGRAAEAAHKRAKRSGAKVRGREGQSLGAESSVGTATGDGVGRPDSSVYTEEGEVRRVKIMCVCFPPSVDCSSSPSTARESSPMVHYERSELAGLPCFSIKYGAYTD